MDETLRACVYLIVDLIELKNCFNEKPGEKRTILVFMPGLMEIFQLIEAIESEGH